MTGSSGTGRLYVWNDGAIGVVMKGHTILEHRVFTRNEDDEAAPIDPRLGQWLAEHKQCVFDVLIDTVDETHVIEDLPAIAKRDRDNLVRKRIAQHFRDAEFVTSKMLATRRLPRRRLTDPGKKDENKPGRQVYLAGLIDDQALAPWIDSMLAQGTRIRRVTSPALLTPALLQASAGSADGLVLTHLPGGLRQTLVLGGAVRFSRLATLHDSSQKSVLAEIDRTIQYLTSSRRLAAQQVDASRFTVWVNDAGLPSAHQLPARATFKGGQTASVAIVPTQLSGLDTLGPHAGIAPFLVSVAGNGGLEYTTKRVRHHDLVGTWRTRLWAGSGALAAVGLSLALGSGVIAEAVFLDPAPYARMQQRFEQESRSLSEQLSRYELTATESEAISKAADQLRARNTDSREILDLVAAGVANDRGLNLTQVNWLRVPLGNVNSPTSGPGGPGPAAAPAAGMGGPGSGDSMSSMSPMDMAASTPTPTADPISLAIAGSVDREWSKTEANDRVTALVERLLANCRCSTTRLVLPYDPAPAVALSESYISRSTTPLAFEIELQIQALTRGGKPQ